ncbi:MFS transporter [Candidatus Roseilinea sp. NK_OTU-006]|uniref:MFS transporter n=1 Tax=Candidatus Roseilinea sp. NK_OTU-006 TaxID=2704250 RepID=UPI00145D2D13|nr:MFS transporter [Candidatus Roseilinea sp. NK_OTU-006]
MPLSHKDALRNERLNAVEVLLATPFIVVVTQYVPVLVTRLGASPLLLGLLTSGAALMLTVASALGPAWLRRVPDWPRNISIPLLLWRSVLAWVPLLLFLPAFQAEAIVIVVVALNFVAGFSNYTFTAFLSRMTLPDRLARLVSNRWTMLGIGMAVFTVILAAILDAFPRPVNYVIVCALSLAMSLVGFFVLRQVRPLPLDAQAAMRPRARLRDLLAHPPARDYLLITLLAHTAVNAPGPLITLQMVRVLKATDVDFGWYLAVFWVSLAVFGLFVPQWTERFGNVRVFAAACAGLGLQMGILALAPALPMTWIAGFIGGAASVMLQVTAYGLMVQCAPPERFEGYVGAYTAVVNFAVFVGPLVMSAMVAAGLPVAAGLLIAAVARAGAGALSLRLVTE